MSKRIISVYFDAPRFRAKRDQRYPRMAKVLKHTAQIHCPDWQCDIRQVAAPITRRDRNRQGRNGLATNSDKLHAWCAAVERADDGDQLLLIDADTMIVQPLAAVWQLDFDVALTNKRTSRLPFNGGVVFLRVGKRSLFFMQRWRQVNDMLYDDAAKHAPYRGKYGGMNQAALGYMIENDRLTSVDLRWLPCAEWNCCDDHLWKHQREQARIVHVKSGLRRSIFMRRNSAGLLGPLVDQWHAYERDADGAEQATG